MKNTHFICSSALAISALLFAGSAFAQAPWSNAYERPSRPVVHSTPEPEGPTFSWDPLRFGVAGELRTTWPQDAGARRLSGKAAPIGGGVSLHYDAWRPSSRLVAKVDLGWTLTSTSDFQESTQNVERLRTHLLSLGVSARYHIFRWLAPYARLAGGLGWDKLTVDSPNASMHDEQTFGHASLGGGVFLRSPGLCLRSSPPSFCVAFMGQIEGGYMLASSSSFALKSSPPGGVSSPVPTESVPIGDVGRNAPYLRASLGFAF
jgi:hypothetical protein